VQLSSKVQRVKKFVEALSVAVAINAAAALIFSSGVMDIFNAKTSQ